MLTNSNRLLTRMLTEISRENARKTLIVGRKNSVMKWLCVIQIMRRSSRLWEVIARRYAFQVNHFYER
ncbi:unnamed protein product [Haemonchus placei]|uniref:Uncharacterized protein n=1 Tax=Haemonchus placei TaxID=6290 RepID=A0A3P7VTP0_HAEPC|nr:unnamed protein product [Haemonchus placei]